MQDNFNIVCDYIKKYHKEGIYYNIAVIKRHVDGHKSGNSMNRTIKQYFVSGIEDLEKYKDEITILCETFGARAYFDPQQRRWDDYALEMNSEIAERMVNKSFDKINRIVWRAAAKCKRDKLWIIDIDDPVELPQVEDFLESSGNLYRIILKIKTNKGYHIIIQPFDTRDFIIRFPDIEIKKNNMTLLYFPNILS